MFIKNLLLQLLRNKTFLTVLALAFSVALIVQVVQLSTPDSYALNSCNTGWAIGPPTEINCHGTCKVVSNNGDNSFFVGTRASAEWLSFRRDPAPGASISSCSDGGSGGGGGGGGGGSLEWCQCIREESCTSPRACSCTPTQSDEDHCGDPAKEGDGCCTSDGWAGFWQCNESQWCT